jgi:hypothetical protein
MQTKHTIHAAGVQWVTRHQGLACDQLERRLSLPLAHKNFHGMLQVCGGSPEKGFIVIN